VTGATGFLGWHTRCALKARGVDVITLGRDFLSESTSPHSPLAGVDAILHLAGVNRSPYRELFLDNISLARHLTAALDRAGSRPTIVYANSIQSGADSPFGQTKQAAAFHLIEWGQQAGAVVADVHLPNLFGEHGKPDYNSVVATFCHTLARGGQPRIVNDKDVPLLHVQDAVDRMLDLVEHPVSGVFDLEAWPIRVSDLLTKLEGFRNLYKSGDIPDIARRFDRALFNTYRSFCFPDQYPIRPTLRSDERGMLFECLGSLGGETQVFSSQTHPAVTRGDHFHLRKVERFIVLRGSAVISLRRLFHDNVVRFKVSGDSPVLIDMPTMWAHSITNTGPEAMTTLFWADEIFDPSKPDTYPERVDTVTAHS
jgi:UDP-2-acetamido-2,6-beta-L-arabino-hexul-4-ose reductase